MDFKSLSKLKFLESEGIYDIFSTVFVYDDTVQMGSYVIERDVTMRSDLLIDRIYNLDGTQSSGAYYDYIDVLMFINNISNSLNIKENDTIIYPINPSDLDRFIFSGTNDTEREAIMASLSYVDKSNKIDKSRKDFKENNYVLPPTLNESPKLPVNVNGTKIQIGGI